MLSDASSRDYRLLHGLAGLVARHAATSAKKKSVYRRFQRFCACCMLPPHPIVTLFFSLSLMY